MQGPDEAVRWLSRKWRWQRILKATTADVSVHTACAHYVCANRNVGFAVEDKRVPSSSKPSQKRTVLCLSRWWWVAFLNTGNVPVTRNNNKNASSGLTTKLNSPTSFGHLDDMFICYLYNKLLSKLHSAFLVHVAFRFHALLMRVYMHVCLCMFLT